MSLGKSIEAWTVSAVICWDSAILSLGGACELTILISSAEN